MQELRLEASGLWTEPSELAAPPGALREALNVRIKRANVIEPRPGFPETTLSTGSGAVRNLFSWQGYVWCVVGTKLYRVQDDGTAAEVTKVNESAASLVITSHESAFVAMEKELYVTTDDGVYYIEDPAVASATYAGVPGALMPVVELATGTGIADAHHVAFRSVVSYEVNERLVLSAPSQSNTLTNASGGAKSAALRVGLQEFIAAGMKLQIYRTEVVSTSTPTGDEMYLSTEYTIVAGDITAGYVDLSLLLITGESLGASLYTNETQQGILQGADKPLAAKVLSSYEGMAFYGNVTPHYAYIYEAQATREGDNFYSLDTGTTTLGGFTVSGLTSGHTYQIGSYISSDGYAGIADAVFSADTLITGTTATTVTIDKAALSAATGSVTIHDVVTIAAVEYRYGPAVDLATHQVQLATDLASAVNADGNAVMLLIGSGLPVVRITSSAAFSIDAETTAEGSASVGPFGLWDSTVINADAATETHPARVMYSKQDQPEAVPAVHYVDIGDLRAPVLGMVTTRDSLFVFKSDGVWRVSGDTPETLRVDEFDRSVRAIHPRAITAFGNAAWAWTTNGVVQVSDAGVDHMSDPSIQTLIDPNERQIASMATVPGGTFMSGFEQHGCLLFGVTATTDSGQDATAEYIYCHEASTGAWTRWSSSVDWLSATEHNGTFVIGGASQAIRLESTLFYDVSSTVTVSSSSGAVTYDGVTYAGQSDITSAAVKAFISAGAAGAWIIANTTGTTYIVTEELTDGSATLFDAIECRVDWAAIVAGNPSALKHWRSMTLLFGDATLLPAVTCGFTSERVVAASTIEHKLHRGDDGEQPGPVILRGNVPRSHARCARLRPYISIPWTRQDWSLEGVALTFEAQRGGERMP